MPAGKEILPAKKSRSRGLAPGRGIVNRIVISYRYVLSLISVNTDPRRILIMNPYAES